MIGDVLFDHKTGWTHLTVDEVEGGYRYTLTGNDAGTRTYANPNKYKVTNAGKKAQREMESEILRRRQRLAGIKGRL
jgi:hypothetical protein